MIVRTFTDPRGAVRELHIGAEEAGVRHDCDQLAIVTPELDVAYCDQCGFQCRISGAWYTELLEDVLAATRDAIAGATPADLEDLWKEERERAAAVMAEDDQPITGPRIRLPQSLIEMLTPAQAAMLLEDLNAIRPLIPVIEPTPDATEDVEPVRVAAAVSEDDPAIEAGLKAISELVGTPRNEAAGLAYIIGSVDAARAQANWIPWWLQPVVRTEPSDEYYDGVRDGIRAHATISDGELLVGALRKPIDKVLAEVDAYQQQRRYWRFG